ncbi:MAG: aminoacyl-tRNA hydrolase [Rhodobacteraceae bacterium]|nr:aminoacyl-tRNA hydrolase [Paracoccaceae bacterium]
MKLFVGLGNPGARYAGNRHNIGFMAVERIAADHGFSPWRKAFRGQVSEGRLDGEKVLLLKPETFMNLSGESVRAAIDFYKLAPADVIVFHDELDLAPGRVRVKQGGGHAGHNGLRSLHQHLGEAYGRVRIGIGHPGHRDRVSGYVLSDFGRDEADWVEAVLCGISEGAGALAAGDAAGFQNRVALRVSPPRPGGERPARSQAGAGGAPRPDPAAAKAPLPEAGAGAGDRPARSAAGAGERPPPEGPDPRSPLQRLVDRFR